MKNKLIIAVIILAVIGALGVIGWKVVRYNKGEDFSSFSGMMGEVAEKEEKIPTVNPGSVTEEGSFVSPSPTITPVPVRVKDVLVTEHEALLSVLGDKEKKCFYGDEITGKMEVLDDTVMLNPEGVWQQSFLQRMKTGRGSGSCMSPMRTRFW